MTKAETIDTLREKRVKNENRTRCKISITEKKNAKGITLIALVVTIVVLIILATISINAVFGENGLIKRAEASKRLQELEEEKQRLELIKTEVLADNLRKNNGRSIYTSTKRK